MQKTRILGFGRWCVSWAGRLIAAPRPAPARPMTSPRPWPRPPTQVPEHPRLELERPSDPVAELLRLPRLGDRRRPACASTTRRSPPATCPRTRATAPSSRATPSESELLKRITLERSGLPDAAQGHPQDPDALEIATLQKWVKQGAKYKQHWAYITPKEVKPERTEWDEQAVNPIDRYIYAGLKKARLSPSPEADHETLINRVTLDLTGLPPTLAEVDAFLADKSPNAYEKLVDRLLASPAYAERQANIWLDVAPLRRHQRRPERSTNGSFTYPYRDWVITAFQRNLPYDKFVTWQLAGDKLPQRRPREQVLATAFLRAGKQGLRGRLDRRGIPRQLRATSAPS